VRIIGARWLYGAYDYVEGVYNTKMEKIELQQFCIWGKFN